MCVSLSEACKIALDTVMDRKIKESWSAVCNWSQSMFSGSLLVLGDFPLWTSLLFPLLRVNPKVTASLTYCTMSLKVYGQVKEERKTEKGPFSTVALAVSARRKL